MRRSYDEYIWVSFGALDFFPAKESAAGVGAPAA
jgi:hypothetical protein